MSATSTSLLVRLYRLLLVYLGAHFPRFVKAENWDEQYARGDWDVLCTDPVQMGHNMVILGYVLRTRPNPRILDVGCGQGALFEYVKRVGMPFERYLGIDLSSEAVKMANKNATPGSEFRAADAQEFTTDERFDAIIFSEVAWYFKDPGAEFLRYSKFLREGGVIIVSMYALGRPARAMWASAARHFDIVDETQINVKVHTWDVRLLAKRA